MGRLAAEETQSGIRIVHLVPGLGAGGAETMLYQLLRTTDRNTFDPVVVSMTDRGSLGQGIEALGIPVVCLGMVRGRFAPLRVVPSVQALGRLKPRVIQTWMYHADLLGGLAGRCLGGVPVVWGLHHTELDAGKNQRLTILTAKTCALLSGVLPQKIICCSESTRTAHRKLGYRDDRMVVIPNGFDAEAFAPDQEVGIEVRRELAIPSRAPIVGLVARFHPAKDHHNFVRAAAILARSLPQAVFVLCGSGVDDENTLLVNWIRDAGLSGSFRLLGERADISRIIQSFDISGTSSISEAFPLVVGEAMACGVPCVVTDVGDSAAIVGETGLVVPAGNPAELAAAWASLLALDPAERRGRGEQARMRVLDQYNLPSIARRYQDVHLSLVSDS